ncbi:MAG: PEP-CTERM sorting domain-containing protein [Planctomycetota bacterium]|nr:PEP-CTERM sorting domain-containing protein [Planctomycetota bacterium]
MKKFTFTLMAFACLCVPAAAATINTTFDAWTLAPVVLGDKQFTYIAGGSNFNNAAMTFTSTVFPTQIVHDVDVQFAPGLTNTTIDLDYSILVLNPLFHISGMGLDAQIGALGTNFDLTKTYYNSPGHVGQIAQLTSVNGGNVSILGNFGQLIYVHVTSTVPAGNEIDSFRDGYIQSSVPEPASFLLAGFGVLGLVSLNWVRRRATAKSDRL